MSLIYDPKKKKPRLWTILFILVIPVILIIIFLTVGKNMKKEYVVDEKEYEVKVDEVFKKF